MISKRVVVFVVVVFMLAVASFAAASTDNKPGNGVPILLYHRLGPTVADSMTITTPVFESHLKYLKQNGYTVIPLRQLIDSLKNKKPLPEHAVVIVADDGHKSIYTDMLPLAKKYQIPVTLFIYPSAISNASYAMTWAQLKELKETGLFDLQSHTYWHPNFKIEKKKLDQKDYEKLVETQLKKSKDRLEKEFGTKIDLLAWPFGIYDDYLAGKASEAGYTAAFSIERRPVKSTDNMMSLPRFLLENANQGKSFERLLAN
ncbi:MAG: polysaccharide deacetylase family protein [Candidatus Magnetominusculus sp. LBB02]|nr:polysaccharide deacetylase family protein [Candidatus Magnetominusculus sp. LBB02]